MSNNKAGQKRFTMKEPDGCWCLSRFSHKLVLQITLNTCTHAAPDNYIFMHEAPNNLIKSTLTATMSADVAKSLEFTSIARSYKTIIPLKITNSTSLDSYDQKITSSTKLQMITVFYFSGFFNFFVKFGLLSYKKSRSD